MTKVVLSAFEMRTKSEDEKQKGKKPDKRKGSAADDMPSAQSGYGKRADKGEGCLRTSTQQGMAQEPQRSS